MTTTLALCYHAISATWPAALSTTPERFERQIALLSRRGYRSRPFTEVASARREPGVVAITFDDAYRSVLREAKPVLDEYGMRASVFVPTAFAGTERPMAWEGVSQWIGGEYEQELIPMSWDELGELQDAGWEIGSHTRTHPHLSRLDDEALGRELVESRAEVAAELGSCTSLAYPYGDHDERTVRAARAAGYRAAGTLPGALPRKTSPHAFPRIGVYFADDDRRFRAKISPAMRTLRASRAWRIFRG